MGPRWGSPAEWRIDACTSCTFNPDTKQPAPGSLGDGPVARRFSALGTDTASEAQVVSLEVMSMDAGLVGTANVLPLAPLKSSVLRFTE